MNTSPDKTVRGGLELPSLTAITHATDEQKNRSAARQRRRKPRRKGAPPQEADAGDALQPDVSECDDEERSQVDYLA